MFELQEKQSFDLTEKASGATQFYVGGGWKAPSGSWDLDFSAIAIHDNGSTSMAYFSNKSILGGAIRCGNDEQSGGDGVGDDEHILIDTSKIPADVNKVALVANIYSGGTFGEIKKAYMRICNGSSETAPELFRFPLVNNLSGKAVEFGFLKRTDSGWEFEATGVEIPNGSRLGNIEPRYGSGSTRRRSAPSSSAGSTAAPQASSGGSSALPIILVVAAAVAAAAFFLL